MLTRCRIAAATAALAVVLTLVACSTSAPAATTQKSAPPTLRALASKRGLMFGTAADAAHLVDDARYPKVLAAQFNALTPEYEMYWNGIHPDPHAYHFGPTDALVRFAQAHSMQVRGHVLVWNQSNPPWLTTGAFTASQLSAVLAQHIATVVGRYRGRIAQWDVVNEAFDDRGKLRRDVWGRTLGVRYIAAAFKAAHHADPKAKLFYNDYNLEFPGPKADAVFAEVKKLKAQKIPIAGVGFQMHVLGRHAPAAAPFPSTQQLATQMRRYQKLGLEVAVTEFDERMPLPATAADLRAQRTAFDAALSACLAAPNCHTFNTWGFTDQYSWIPSWYPGFGAATMLDRSYRAKPAYAGLRDALERAPAG